MLLGFLQNELSKRSRKNPGYSLRAFARSLNMSAGSLSSLLSGQRTLTAKTAERILNQLELNPIEREQLFLSTFQTPKLEKDRSSLIVQRDLFELVSSWEHDAVLSALQLANFKATPNRIARKLNLSIGVVLVTLARLERLKLVEKRGVIYRATHKNLVTAPDVSPSAIRKVHRQYVDKARESIDKVAAPLRNISGITMAIDSKKLPEAAELIREFRQKLCRFLESSEADQVYRLNLQLFPIQGDS